MKVIRLNKAYLAIASGLLALFVVLGISTAAQAADPCVNVTLLSSGLKACVPVSSLPTVTVAVPRVTTVTVRPPAVTRYINRTVTVDRVLPRGTTTVTLRSRSTVKVPVRETVTAVKTVVVPQTGGTNVLVQPRQTDPKAATITGPTVAKTVTVVKTAPPKDAVVLTKVKAATISLLLILIGVGLAVLLVWAAFTYGWFKGDNGNREFLRELRDGIKYR